VEPIRRWIYGSCALLVVGAFGPWAKVLGVLSVSGIDLDDGWLLVAVAVACSFAAYRDRWVAGAALAGGAVAALVSIGKIVSIDDAVDSTGLVSIGWGLTVDAVASVSLAVAGLYALSSSRKGAVARSLDE
jgi:hypothetical protein